MIAIPPAWNPVGTAQTVLGQVDARDLGITMTHEHLLIDASHLAEEPGEAGKKTIFHAPLTMDILGKLKYGGLLNRDNMRLMDVHAMIEEVRLYKEAGGSTVVDVTSIGINRDPHRLAQIARATGLNVIMGSSYYVAASHPADMDAKTENEILEEIVRDILHGVDHGGIRAGIIGEVGCSWPLTDNERKVLRASGRAQRITGAPLSIHPGRYEFAPMEIIEVLRGVGTDVDRTIMCHLERTIFERSSMKALAETGCLLEFDLFGQENSYYHAAPHIDMPNDAGRLKWVEWLIAEGHGRQIVIAHDIDWKYFLVRYGGHGYAHIPANIVPRMRRKGFREEHIQAILVENPRRVLAFVPPSAA